MDHGAEFRFGAQRVADKGLAFEPPDRAAAAQRLDRHAQHVARRHRLAEARFFDGHEIDDALVARQAQGMHHQRARGLGHRFHDQHARHHRIIGKMALEMRLVVATPLSSRWRFRYGTMSVSRSTNRNGARCGSNFLICSTSSTTVGVISHGRPACGGVARSRSTRVNFPQPFSYRFRRNAAIILSAGNAPGRKPWPCAPPAGRPAPIWTWSASPTWPPSTAKSSITELPATPTWRHQHAMPADLHIVADLHQIIELAAFADHRVAQRAAVDGGAGADLDAVLDDDAAQLRNLDMARRRTRRNRSPAGRSARPAGS